MTLKKAKATGKLKTADFSGGCMHAVFKNKKYRSPVGVLFSKKYGFQPSEGKVAIMWMMSTFQDCAN